MPICRHCNKFIKPLGMPVSVEEQMFKALRGILELVEYTGGYRPPHYPLPAVRLVAEYQPRYSWIIVYDDNFDIHKVWLPITFITRGTENVKWQCPVKSTSVSTAMNRRKT